MTEQQQPPLAGIKVVELANMIATPAATHLLATQGASVVKVEDAGSGDDVRRYGSSKNGMSGWFANANAGKWSVALDLNDEDAKRAMWHLIDGADVFVEGFRPGVVERLGFGWDEAHERNPGLIYVSSSGFGPSGPYSDRPVFDPVIQALAGWAGAQVTDGEPKLIRGMVADKTAAMTTAQAITAALLGRAATGDGRRLQMSMLESSLAFNWPDVMMHATLLDDDAQHQPNLLGAYRLFACADGYVTAAAGNDAQWSGMCTEFDRPDLITDERFANVAVRVQNMPAWYDEIEAMLTPHPVAEALDRLHRADVPAVQVLDPTESADDEQVRATGAVVEVDHPVAGRMRVPQQAARFMAADEIAPAPSHGDHTVEVLRAVGLDEATIDAMFERGVAKGPR